MALSLRPTEEGGTWPNELNKTMSPALYLILYWIESLPMRRQPPLYFPKLVMQTKPSRSSELSLWVRTLIFWSRAMPRKAVLHECSMRLPVQNTS